MTEEKVIEMAREYAGQRGYDPERYGTTAERAGDEWHVFFRGKELRPGDFFSVLVDDGTETVKELVPGK